MSSSSSSDDESSGSTPRERVGFMFGNTTNKLRLVKEEGRKLFDEVRRFIGMHIGHMTNSKCRISFLPVLKLRPPPSPPLSCHRMRSRLWTPWATMQATSTGEMSRTSRLVLFTLRFAPSLCSRACVSCGEAGALTALFPPRICRTSTRQPALAMQLQGHFHPLSLWTQTVF